MRWLPKWLKKKPKLIDFSQYEGEWIAVKKGVVLAHAPTTAGLFEKLDSSAAGCTIWKQKSIEDYTIEVARRAAQQRLVDRLGEPS